MTKHQGAIYNLEERTLMFSKNLITLLKQLPRNDTNEILINQCLRSGTSVGANYREANETETKRDFKFRIRICRKEAKETVYWLKLLEHTNANDPKVLAAMNEAQEFTKIFAAILLRSA